MNHRHKVLLGTIVATICGVVGAAPAAAVAAGPTITITTPVEGQHFALNAAITAAFTLRARRLRRSPRAPRPGR